MTVLCVSMHIVLIAVTFRPMLARAAAGQAAAESDAALMTRIIDVDGVAIRVRTGGVDARTRPARATPMEDAFAVSRMREVRLSGSMWRGSETE